VAIVDPWDFPSEQSFRTRTRYDYKPKTLSAGARNLTAALCGRNNQMAKEHMADPTILSTHRAKNRSTKECGWKHGNRGGRGSKGKNPKKERKKERKKENKDFRPSLGGSCGRNSKTARHAALTRPRWPPELDGIGASAYGFDWQRFIQYPSQTCTGPGIFRGRSRCPQARPSAKGESQ
jgi:hypothetical protein